MFIEVLGAAIVVMIVSLSGVVFTHRVARTFLEDRLSYLVSFSAGVFLVTAGFLILEVFELGSSVGVAAGMVTLGYVLAWLLHRLLPETHHHHDPACGRSHGGARKLIIGDAFHNIADGIVLAVAILASPVIGLAVLVSVVVHETLQEISEFFVLRQAGYSTVQALLINLLVSSTILIGAGLGYFALASSELEMILLALSAGFFLQVVVHDLLPRRMQHETATRFVEHILLVLVGVIMMGSINTVLGDAHIHGEAEGHSDDHSSEVPHSKSEDEHQH